MSTKKKENDMKFSTYGPVAVIANGTINNVGQDQVVETPRMKLESRI